MKYYLPEHVEGYARISAEGKSSWDELHGSTRFEDALIRAVLEEAWPHLSFKTSHPHVLEYGCGTGPGACWMAEHGCAVDAIDLSDQAIAIAGREAKRRGLMINYSVADVCAQWRSQKQYQLIVDSYCLQCIVTESDRGKLLASVQGALATSGRYLIATAGFHQARDYADWLFDPASGVSLVPVEGSAEDFPDAIEHEGRWYIPGRRHVTMEALTRELQRSGFTTEWSRVSQTGDLLVIAHFAGQT